MQLSHHNSPHPQGPAAGAVGSRRGPGYLPSGASEAAPRPRRDEPPAEALALDGRSWILDRIDLALQAGPGRGCLLVGGPGIGKTSLIQQVLRRREDHYVVQVRGSEFAGRSAFGALTFLLSDLDPQASAHPVLILRGLSNLIRERADGRPVLLAVDNAEDLDEFSAMVLNQLVLGKTAAMVAAFRDLNRAPGEFMGLWREGLMDRIDVPALDAGDAAALIRAHLGGPVTQTAVQQLRSVSGSNPLLLGHACADYREGGWLRRDQGTWVIHPTGPEPLSRMAEAVLDSVGELADDERDLLHAVALSGLLRLADAERFSRPEVVDRLQERGLLVLEPVPVAGLRIASPVLAGAALATVNKTERRRLRRELGHTGGEPLAEARWRLSIDEPLDAADAAPAAASALESGDAAAAAALIPAAAQWSDHPESLLTAARARIELSDFAGAAQVLQLASGVEAADATAVRLILARCRLLCLASTGAAASGHLAGLSEDHVRGHKLLLDQAAGMAGGTGTSETDPGLAREVLLARATCNSAHGRFTENINLLSGLAEAYDPGFRLASGSLLVEALGLTDRQADAFERAREVEQMLPHRSCAAATRITAAERLLTTYLAAGALDGAQRLLELAAEHGLSSPLLTDLGEGLRHACAGSPEDALAVLEPGLAQVLATGPLWLIPPAAAAAAYSFALLGDGDQAGRCLKLRDRGRDGGPWVIRRTARHFAALADAALGAERAVDRLRNLADQDGRRGAAAFEMLSRFTGLRLGDHEAVEQVLGTSARLQGDFARSCETYAKALAAFDVQLLLEAGQMGAACGHTLLAREASERALAMATGSGDRATVRLIHQARRTGNGQADQPEFASELLDALTQRERTIAVRAAAGASNKAIAEELGISVRTVEGHLYQVYSKLHVASRRELARLLSERSGAVK